MGLTILKFFEDILSSSGKSSARLLNILVGVTLIGLAITDTIMNSRFSTEIAMVLAGYGVGGFGISKSLKHKETTDE